MTKKSRKVVFISITSIVVAGCAVVYYLWNKPHKDVKHAAAVAVTATDLYNTFINDSIKAKIFYTDKVVEVSGEVIRISKNQQNQQIILLRTAVAGAAVNCTMEENAGAVKQGGNIIIKGICSGYIAGNTSMNLPGDVFIIRGYYSK